MSDHPINVANRAQVEGDNLSSYLHLLDVANEAKANAYSPYSKFKVGAALLTHKGEVITACNVENASYGLTICAERSAVVQAVAKGYGPGDFEAIAVAASADDFSPCGACRQVLNEFGTEMIVVFPFKGEIVITRLKELLPYNFNL